MAGEAHRTYATVHDLDAESKPQNEGAVPEQLSDKTAKESSETLPSASTEAGAAGRRAKFIEKKRDYTQQREAVIRPQQAGKIDFKSLQNRPKFASDRTWPGGKGSPQSPNGKSRSRDKGKRAGKSERGNPQQLYRLSITNPRSNPTIGIAYPQQKVSPPKKLEAGRGPVTGSYRFHVPSFPEREAELQQEELSYSRCFQEASPSNLTSPTYTSQTLGSAGGASTHQHPPQTQTQTQSQLQQPPGPMENTITQPGNHLLFPDFQLSGSNTWQSPERTFNSATYGISSQKSSAPAEGNKASSGFVPMTFQYGYQLLEDSTPDPFPCDQNPQSQDFMDSTTGPGQVAHTSFSYQAPGEGQEGAQNNPQFGNEQSEDRSSYPHPAEPAQYLQAPPGVSSSMHCSRAVSEDSASSESSGSSFQQSEQNKSASLERSEVYGQADSRDPALSSGSKRRCHPKDGASQRTTIQGSGHQARTTAQGPSSQMHFQNKTFNSPPLNNVHMGTVPFDKSLNNKVHSRLPHSWEGPTKAYSPADQNSLPYSSMNEKFPFQNQATLEQRPNTPKGTRNAWQQIHLTPTMPNQNRIELSRQLSNQKVTYLVSPSDWQDESKTHKNGSMKSTGLFQSSRTAESYSNPRQDSVKQSCNTISSFKVETSHAQVCESKNKVFFGLNQSLPGASSSRTYGYPPLQVPPMGLMMVSPYESPSPSPIHNPAPSSTCSSLSPASTSPANLSSEDSQMSKAGPPPPFYHQHQVKAQVTSDLLSTNPHHFHPDAPRNLPYVPERAKDNMMSYLQNNGHPKPTMEGNKGYMEGFAVDHQPPPPPYSAHQLLATSLATANLDQLDVLLTCKQCDQNFNNLASFLGHKQYCGQHAFAQNDFKDVSKMEESRKFHAEVGKASSSGSSLCQTVTMPRCPTDLHFSLLGLSRNGDFITDSETKADSKEDLMKLNLFSGPGTLPDLEMEDAKLDSLITEALNGLGYQSDNAEIDSSFIDAFADDDLTTVKVTSNRQSVKTKESIVFESKSKQTRDDDRSLTQGKCLYDSDAESLETYVKHTETKLEKTSLNLEHNETINIKKEVSHKKSRIASGEKSKEHENKVKEARKLCKSEDEIASAPRFLLSSKFSERCGVKSFQESSFLRGTAPTQASIANTSSPTQRTGARESKRKKTGGGTWSKELIHKIVQQKNKLHKLHVKGTKNLQFSLVMERLTPALQNPTFREYDYVSDSDDECEPVKIASQGRLSQSSRCKYTYTKECKWRARSERDRAAWRHESKECFEVKKSEDISLSPEKHDSQPRLRRRGSRSSTSSELSTSVSVSSDSISSPKSTERTDSDCEKKVEFRRRDSPEQKIYERSPQKLCKETSTQLALTFTKSTKKYGADKTNTSANKDHAETLKIHHSRFDDIDSVSVLPRARCAVKKLEKCKIPDLSTAENDVSEYSPTIVPDKHTPLKANGKKLKLEPTNMESTGMDCKLNQLESQATSHKDSKPHHKSEIFTKEKSGHKQRDSVGPQSTQPKAKLSDTTAFEKHSVGAYSMKEQIPLTNDLVPKSTSLCSALMDEVCLSPAELQEPLTQKETSHLLPYPLEQDQSLIKSPLSFDTSSMFGDLTVAGFENGLYADMPLHKVSFNPLESTSDKKEVYTSSFSPFLEQRDWGLMDVGPMLPDEISEYKDDSEKGTEKKSDFSHVTLSLPDKIMDYSGNLSSCEDELEIKRIVTELENQLQTTKLSNPTPLTEEAPNELKMSKFSPLRLGEDEDSSLHESFPVQSMPMAVSTIQSVAFAEPGLPWTSPFHFDLIEGQHTPTHAEPGVEKHLTKTEHDDSVNHLIPSVSHSDTNHQKQDSHKPEGTEENNRTASDLSEEILERKMYAENLMKSLEVISDSVFKKGPLSSEQEELRALSPESQEQTSECLAPGTPECDDEKQTLGSDGENIEFILNESQPSLSDDTLPLPDLKQPSSLQPSESVENNSRSDSEVISTEKDNHVSETSHCPNIETDYSPVDELTCEEHQERKREEGVPKDSTDLPDQSELLDTTTNNSKEVDTAVAVNFSCQFVRPPSVYSNHTDQETEEDPQPTNPEKFTYKEEESMNAQKDEVGCSSVSADEAKEVNSACVKEQDSTEEDAVRQDGMIDHIAFESCSENAPQSQENYCAGPVTDLSMDMVTDTPSSPLLMELSTEHVSQHSPSQDITLTGGDRVAEHDAVPSGNVLALASFGGQLEMDSISVSVPRLEEEISNVEDINEQVPIRLMASPLISVDKGKDEGLNQEASPTPSPPPASPHSSAHSLTKETPVTQEAQCQPQNSSPHMNINQEPIYEAQSCDELHTKESLNNAEPLAIPARMEYSLISPPHLGITSTEPAIPSPHPLCITAEPSHTVEANKKRDMIYDFKLSPLNYNDKSDVPPELNQYNYTPVSPDNRLEETDFKRSPRGNCGPCDLSHNTALIQDQRRIGAEPTTSLVHSAELILPEETVDISSSVHDCLKLTCIALGFPLQGNTASSSNGNTEEDLEMCHDRIEPNNYQDMHVDLLKKMESENLNVHEVPCEAPLLKEDTADSQLIPKPLITCENEFIPSPSDFNEEHLPPEVFQSSTSHHSDEEAQQKKRTIVPNKTQLGKVLCEICSMCFRTVPGLKRHRAMKHLVRTDRNTHLENVTSSHQGSRLRSLHLHTAETGHKDDSQICLQTEIDGVTANHGPEMSKNSFMAKQTETDLVLKDTAIETNMAPIINQQTHSLQTKAKKNNKARKNKNSEVQVKPDPFSDELLNILKTDILQALSPEFRTRVHQECQKSPERRDELSSHVKHSFTKQGEAPLSEAVDRAFEDIYRCQPEKTDLLSLNADGNQNNADSEEVNCSVPDIGRANGAAGSSTDVSTDYVVAISRDEGVQYDGSQEKLTDVKAMRKQQSTDGSLAAEILGEAAVEIKCEENSHPTNEDPVSCLKSPQDGSPGLSPDLKAFLDDESSFSQLFPRDEEMKRKKCARVYGKKNKKQKIISNSPVPPDYPPPDMIHENKEPHPSNQMEETFVNNRDDHGEHKTISIDDAILLNLCHNSTLKCDVKEVCNVTACLEDHEDIDGSTAQPSSDFFSPTENTIDKSSIAWTDSSDLSSFVPVALSDSAPNIVEAPPTSCSLPIKASSPPRSEQPCVTDTVPPFHSIDMQSIRTTFQLPDIQLFDSNKILSEATPMGIDDTETRETEKPKKPTERRGRKRQDGSLKIKDKQYKCKVCFTWFLTLGELNFHKLSHNPSPPPTCYMCVQRKFSSREQLRDHLKEKHTKNKAGIWTCGMCLKEMSDVWMYNEHLREHATQFARKGQTQSSILGMAGGIMQESAVKTFITSIMQRRPSKANRESSKSTSKDQAKAAPETSGQEVKPTEAAEPKVPKTKVSSGEGGSSKQSNLTPLEVLHKSDAAPKNVEMHPNCKDPSRDCHHCGKQFPKPFKLQRHLVVHNLEKIFLCHKCPVSYQESQDLKDHLKREHEEVEELDSKHTTLYTCELCADVMHVIKKSFICSTCNYTFSKKEQFDRHMEKHLSGGNKIFKFRGVFRPLKVSTSKENESDMPSSKRRKIVTENIQENSSDSGIASITSVHLNLSSEKHAIPTAEDSTQTSAAEYRVNTNDASVKTEDVGEDYSEPEHCVFNTAPSETEGLSTAAPKTEDVALGPSTKLPGRESSKGQSITEPCEVKEEEESQGHKGEVGPQWPTSQESDNPVEEREVPGRARRNSSEGVLPACTGEAEERKTGRRELAAGEPNEELSISFPDSQIKASHKTPDLQFSPRKSLAVRLDQANEDELGPHPAKINDNKQIDLSSSHGCEQQGGGSVGRERGSPAKPSDSTEKSSISSPRIMEATPVPQPRLTSQGLAPSEDRDSLRQQKKRKELRSPHSQQRVSSPATRENLSLDPRPKKKFRPNKCESPAVHRRSDSPSDYPVLSSVREDVVSNKIMSQHKTLGLKLKRSPLDTCIPKKMEIAHHMNGDYKAKKGPVGRPLHPPISKVSPPPMNNSLNKQRPKTGVRTVDSQSYRTAESQNNLLSQLFGQKLTSFKIPLRKDN